MTAGFEVAGMFGILTAGWLTDRIFDGKTQKMGIVCMMMSGLAMFAFWKSPPGHVTLNTSILMVAGFFIYGPQAADRNRRRQPRHQACGCDVGGINGNLRLRQHGAVGLGHGIAGAEVRMGRGVSMPDRDSGGGDGDLYSGVACAGAWV